MSRRRAPGFGERPEPQEPQEPVPQESARAQAVSEKQALLGEPAWQKASEPAEPGGSGPRAWTRGQAEPPRLPEGHSPAELERVRSAERAAGLGERLERVTEPAEPGGPEQRERGHLAPERAHRKPGES